MTISASIHTAVELDDLTPISEFEQNHGIDTVRLSIDSGCWLSEDIVIQTKLGMSALVAKKKLLEKCPCTTVTYS